MPPNNEYTITAPLPESELRQLIHEVSIFTSNYCMYSQFFFHSIYHVSLMNQSGIRG